MTAPSPALLEPAYDGACIANLVPALLSEARAEHDWLPAPARALAPTVLLVLDGIGWDQLRERPHVAPTMTAAAGGPITSVAPTTTATALCSILLGSPPAEHGVVGYRMRVEGDLVLNALRWRTAEGDARQSVPPAAFQPRRPFLGHDTPVVTKAEFRSTGFTTALGIDRLHGWEAPSSIAVEVGQLLRAGEPFVYAYYDGVDKIAHAKGFGPHYDAELAAADRLVADVAAAMPPGAVLVVTADHGQVEVGDRVIVLDDDVMADVALTSGEARFLWLHARPGRAEALAAQLRARYEVDGTASVLTREEVIARGLLGGDPAPAVRERLGDVAVLARDAVAFLDPADTGSVGLRCRHGSLTAAELLVPLLAVGSP